MGQIKKLHMVLVTPKDSVDCNQLTSLLFENTLDCPNTPPKYRVGVPCLFWLNLRGYTTNIYTGNAQQARDYGAVDVSVNELTRQLALWA